MDLNTTGFVLFLHIFLVIAGLGLATVLHAGLLFIRTADDVASIRSWPRVIATLEAALPIVAVVILATGAWLLHLSGGEFAWDQGWVIASVTGLVVAFSRPRTPVSIPEQRRVTTQTPHGSG